MPDYALFLKCNGNSTNGNFEENKRPRKPVNRFWDEVRSIGGVLTGQSRRSNANARKIELAAPKNAPFDNVYFAVNTSPTTSKLVDISFMCGIHLAVKGNAATVAAPFRDVNGEIQAHLPNETRFTTILSDTGDSYQAIGPFTVVRDPGAQDEECVFHKLTIVATVRSSSGVKHEFSYDPDMDIELGL
jgi:hypothetical protein